MDKVQMGKLHSGNAAIATRVFVRHVSILVDGLVTKELHEHSHTQEERNVQIVKVLTVVKERAANANDMSTPANIISDATVGLPGAVRAHIVKKNVKRTIQRTRLRTAAAPVNPQNCADLEIPDSYKHILLDDARGPELFCSVTR